MVRTEDCKFACVAYVCEIWAFEKLDLITFHYILNTLVLASCLKSKTDMLKCFNLVEHYVFVHNGSFLQAHIY